MRHSKVRYGRVESFTYLYSLEIFPCKRYQVEYLYSVPIFWNVNWQDFSIDKHKCQVPQCHLSHLRRIRPSCPQRPFHSEWLCSENCIHPYDKWTCCEAAQADVQGLVPQGSLLLHPCGFSKIDLSLLFLFLLFWYILCWTLSWWRLIFILCNIKQHSRLCG